MAPPHLTLPETWVGSSADTSLALENGGDDPVPLLSATAEGAGFSLLDPVPTEVPAHGTVAIRIAFTPEEAGEHSGVVRISLPERSLVASLTALGVAPSPCRLDPCETGIFDFESGTCAFASRPDGTACGEADACSAAVCQDGACVMEAAVDGTACGADDDPCLAGACSQGTCELTPLPDETPCGTSDACSASVCRDGACEVAAVADGTTCGEGDACHTEVCRDGLCIAELRPDTLACARAEPCRRVACDLEGCHWENRADGSACGLGDACTQDVCEAGVCVTEPRADGTACGSSCGEICMAGACTAGASPDGSACDDGDPCTVFDTCTADGCVGTPLDCDDGSVCTADRCEAGQCHHDPVNEGLACDAGGVCGARTACMGVATCSQGSCQQTPLDDGSPCDDGNACTNGDVCAAGLCAGAALDCDDGNPCTVDACDPTVGCEYAARLDGTRCDGGDGCGAADICQGGVCETVASAPDGTSCDDGELCTGSDTCVAGVCGGVRPTATELGDWELAWGTRAYGLRILDRDWLLSTDRDHITLVQVRDDGARALTSRPWEGYPPTSVATLGQLQYLAVRETLGDGDWIHYLDFRLGQVGDVQPLVGGSPQLVGLDYRRALVSFQSSNSAAVQLLVVEGGVMALSPAWTTEGTWLVRPTPLSSNRTVAVSKAQSGVRVHILDVSGHEVVEVGGTRVTQGCSRALVAEGRVYLRQCAIDGFASADVALDVASGDRPRTLGAAPAIGSVFATVDPRDGALIQTSKTGEVTLTTFHPGGSPSVRTEQVSLEPGETLTEVSRRGAYLLAQGRVTREDQPELSEAWTRILDAETWETRDRLAGAVVAWLDADRVLVHHTLAQLSRAGDWTVYDLPSGWSEVVRLDASPDEPGVVNGSDVSAGHGLVLVNPTHGLPTLQRWDSCQDRLLEVPGYGMGEPGRLLRTDSGWRAESWYGSRSVHLDWQRLLSLTPTRPRPYASAMVGQTLRSGPFTTLYGVWPSPISDQGLCSDQTSPLRLHAADSGEIMSVACRAGHPLGVSAEGPLLAILEGTGYTLPTKSESSRLTESTLALYGWSDGAIQPLGSLGGFTCPAAHIVWAAEDGSALALRGDDGCTLLVDTSVPTLPAVAWEAPAGGTGGTTRHLAMAGDHLVRLVDRDGAQLVTWERVDRTALPWSFELEAALPATGMTGFLTFDGTTAVLAGEGNLVSTVDFGESPPAVSDTTLPFAPHWATPTGEALLLSGDSGMATLSVACGP